MLDRSKPYGKICGTLERYPKAYWEQSGRFYTKDGEYVGGRPEPQKEKPLPDLFPKKLHVEQPRKWEIVPDFKGMPLKQARKLHWTQLKQIMKAHGVRYTTLKHARDWIES